MMQLNPQIPTQKCNAGKALKYAGVCKPISLID